MKVTQALLNNLTAQAKATPRLRMNLDLRNSPSDGSQRMLNSLETGTVMPIVEEGTGTFWERNILSLIKSIDDGIFSGDALTE